ncbi:hypothetical protein RCL1_005486 [Eukaryota sp. TZLM3-RCL]
MSQASSSMSNRSNGSAAPALNKTIKGAAAALYGMILHNHEHSPGSRTPRHFHVFDQRKANSVSKPPSFITLYKFIYQLFRRAQIEPECIVVSLTYLERLFLKRPDLKLTTNNFERLIFTAVMVASKFNDDVSCSSFSFSLCSNGHISLKELNDMEAIFLIELDFNLYVSIDTYRDFYYLLKKIWLQLIVDESGKITPLPRSVVATFQLPVHFAPFMLFHCEPDPAESDNAAGIGAVVSPVTRPLDELRRRFSLPLVSKNSLTA